MRGARTMRVWVPPSLPLHLSRSCAVLAPPRPRPRPRRALPPPPFRPSQKRRKKKRRPVRGAEVARGVRAAAAGSARVPGRAGRGRRGGEQGGSRWGWAAVRGEPFCAVGGGETSVGSGVPSAPPRPGVCQARCESRGSRARRLCWRMRRSWPVLPLAHLLRMREKPNLMHWE